MSRLGTFGEVPQHLLPCPSDADPGAAGWDDTYPLPDDDETDEGDDDHE